MIKTISELESFITKNWNTINNYIDAKGSDYTFPLYNSVDIRESENKIAPVDNNIYPAGFNNLCLLDLDAVGNFLEKFIMQSFPQTKSIGILIESHTKNKFYLDNIAYLQKSIRDAGYDNVSIVSFDDNLFENGDKLELETASHFTLDVYKASIHDQLIFADDRPIDFLIMNNDQSEKIDIDFNVVKTPIHPSPNAGWYKRSKSKHFVYYKDVLEDFCKHFEIDPTLLQANFELVTDIDFSSKEGLDKIAQAVDRVKPENENGKVFIKGDQGTYGMGISVVSSGEEVISFNRKSRNKMDIGKNKIKFSSVIVQEGIDTVIKYDNMPAEVTIYLVAGKSAGGFMRANSQKGAQENLNSKGMVFKKFCISEIRQNQDHKAKEALYSIVGRLSSLASAIEINELNN